MSESDQQITVVDYFKAKWPSHVIYASANGAHLAGTKKQRAKKMVKMKREGLLPGSPDLCFAVARGGYHALYIEMKDVNKTYADVSKEQREVMQSLRDAGNKAEWCPGASAAIKIIDEYMALPSYTSFGVDITTCEDFCVKTFEKK